ncbi:hypothetical protein HYV22_02320 [Candidatus Gottesmanbacteria bacterium]|nr:hypothetical protein [Candidatus Gottesmanbacteria bacterium]
MDVAPVTDNASVGLAQAQRAIILTAPVLQGNSVKAERERLHAVKRVPKPTVAESSAQIRNINRPAMPGANLPVATASAAKAKPTNLVQKIANLRSAFFLAVRSSAKTATTIEIKVSGLSVNVPTVALSKRIRVPVAEVRDGYAIRTAG